MPAEFACYDPAVKVMTALDRRVQELEKRTGMARWWERDALGYYYCIRCACGGVVEALYRDEAVLAENLWSAEKRAQDRFVERFPDCPHLKRFIAETRAPDRAMEAASDLVSGIEESWNLFWGP